jgi:hypothetical protein
MRFSGHRGRPYQPIVDGGGCATISYLLNELRQHF